MSSTKVCCLLAALALCLAGCGGRPSPTPQGAAGPIFTPPSVDAAGVNTRTVQGAPPLILDVVGTQLEAQGFKVSHFELDAGEMVIEHRGDAMPYVDCGWLVQFAPDGCQQQTPAAARTIDLNDGTTRDLDLAARLTVRVFVDDQGRTRLRSEATYVLIETIEGEGMATPARAVVNFQSGDTGTFPNGAVCRSTGELERLPGSLAPTA